MALTKMDIGEAILCSIGISRAEALPNTETILKLVKDILSSGEEFGVTAGSDVQVLKHRMRIIVPWKPQLKRRPSVLHLPEIIGELGARMRRMVLFVRNS